MVRRAAVEASEIAWSEPIRWPAAVSAIAWAAWVSSPRIRYRRPRSIANPIRPKITGTSRTSIWTDIAPRRLLLGFLVSTLSYEFRLSGRLLATLLLFLLL